MAQALIPSTVGTNIPQAQGTYPAPVGITAPQQVYGPGRVPGLPLPPTPSSQPRQSSQNEIEMALQILEKLSEIKPPAPPSKEDILKAKAQQIGTGVLAQGLSNALGVVDEGQARKIVGDSKPIAVRQNDDGSTTYILDNGKEVPDYVYTAATSDNPIFDVDPKDINRLLSGDYQTLAEDKGKDFAANVIAKAISNALKDSSVAAPEDVRAILESPGDYLLSKGINILTNALGITKGGLSGLPSDVILNFAATGDPKSAIQAATQAHAIGDIQSAVGSYLQNVYAGSPLQQAYEGSILQHIQDGTITDALYKGSGLDEIVNNVKTYVSELLGLKSPAQIPDEVIQTGLQVATGATPAIDAGRSIIGSFPGSAGEEVLLLSDGSTATAVGTAANGGTLLSDGTVVGGSTAAGGGASASSSIGGIGQYAGPALAAAGAFLGGRDAINAIGKGDAKNAAISGAQAGAAVGSQVAGPVGAVIGAIIGSATSALGAAIHGQKPIGERRRLSIKDYFSVGNENKRPGKYGGIFHTTKNDRYIELPDGSKFHVGEKDTLPNVAGPGTHATYQIDPALPYAKESVGALEPLTFGLMRGNTKNDVDQFLTGWLGNAALQSYDPNNPASFYETIKDYYKKYGGIDSRKDAQRIINYAHKHKAIDDWEKISQEVQQNILWDPEHKPAPNDGFISPMHRKAYIEHMKKVAEREGKDPNVQFIDENGYVIENPWG